MKAHLKSHRIYEDTHLDKNEPRDNRVSLILRKRKALYAPKSGRGSMTTQGQILTGIH